MATEHEQRQEVGNREKPPREPFVSRTAEAARQLVEERKRKRVNLPEHPSISQEMPNVEAVHAVEKYWQDVSHAYTGAWRTAEPFHEDTVEETESPVGNGEDIIDGEFTVVEPDSDAVEPLNEEGLADAEHAVEDDLPDWMGRIIESESEEVPEHPTPPTRRERIAEFLDEMGFKAHRDEKRLIGSMAQFIGSGTATILAAIAGHARPEITTLLASGGLALTSFAKAGRVGSEIADLMLTSGEFDRRNRFVRAAARLASHRAVRRGFAVADRIGSHPITAGVLTGLTVYSIGGYLQEHTTAQQAHASVGMTSPSSGGEKPHHELPPASPPEEGSQPAPVELPKPPVDVTPPPPHQAPEAPSANVVGMPFTVDKDFPHVWGHENTFVRGLVDQNIISGKHTNAITNALKNIAWGLAEPGENIGLIHHGDMVNLLNRVDAQSLATVLDTQVLNYTVSEIHQQGGMNELLFRISQGYKPTEYEVNMIAGFFPGP